MGGVDEPQQRTAVDHYALNEPYFRKSVVCEMAVPGPTAQTVLMFGVASQSDDVKKANREIRFDPTPVTGFSVTPPKSRIECGGVVKVVMEIAPPASSRLQVGQSVVADTVVMMMCAGFTWKVPAGLKCLTSLQQAADLSPSAVAKQSKLARKRKCEVTDCFLFDNIVGGFYRLSLKKG
jgi:hypothetical protein